MTGWNPDRYAEDAGFVASLGRSVVDWLAPAPGESMLDLGCGDGTLTAYLAQSGARVVAVDQSPEMVAAARRRGLDARVVDGRMLGAEADLAASFDAVFSNAALHWMTDPDAVLRGVARVLRPGGRFVGEMGGEGNVGRIVDALRAELRACGVDDGPIQPFYFPSAAAYRRRLESAGFTVEALELFERPTRLPSGLRGWLSVFAMPFLAALPATAHERFVAAVVARLAPDLRDERGTWWADYVRLRFAARRS